MAQTTHAIAQPWRDHITELRTVIGRHQQEIAFIQRHASLLIGQLAKEAQLPEPYEQYQLSDDGTSIVSKE